MREEYAAFSPRRRRPAGAPRRRGAAQPSGYEPASWRTGGGSDANVFNAQGPAERQPERRLRARAHAGRVACRSTALRRPTSSCTPSCAAAGAMPRPQAGRDGAGLPGVAAAARRRRRARSRTPTPRRRDYLDYLRFERGMSPNTVAAYGRDLTRFAAFLDARGRGAAGGGARRTWTPTSTVPAATAPPPAWRGAWPPCAASIAIWCARSSVDGRPRGSPAHAAPRPPRPARVLSVEEVEAVLGRVAPSGPLGQRDLAALELLYGCGLRASASCSVCARATSTWRAAWCAASARATRSAWCPWAGRRPRPLRALRARRAPAAAARPAPRGALPQRPRRPLTRQGLDYILRRSCARGRHRRPRQRAHVPPQLRHPSAAPPAPTCAACRRCSATPTWRRRSSTRT